MLCVPDPGCYRRSRIAIKCAGLHLFQALVGPPDVPRQDFDVVTVDPVSEVLDAAIDRSQGLFDLVELQVQMVGQERFNLVTQLPELAFVRVHERDVVHIAEVLLYPEIVFREHV